MDEEIRQVNIKKTTGRSAVKKKRTVIREIESTYIERVLKRQTGGVVDVPGYGSGDKVPMMVPSGSFVLNRNASAVYDQSQKGNSTGVPYTGDVGAAPKLQYGEVA